MVDKNSRRQVFISHAADDPDWPPEAIDAVASVIRNAGVVVRLDLWHQQAVKRYLSLSEWRGWMDDAIRDASYILCLVSPRYRQLWQRRPEDPGGVGVAFEAIRLIHGLYLDKQRSHGHLLTLRPEEQSHDCIPRDLMLDCAAYVWTGDRAMLLSHLVDGEIPSSTLLSDGLILDGLHYPDRTDTHASASEEFSSSLAIELDALAGVVKDATDIYVREMSVAFEASGVMIPGVTLPPIEVEHEVAAAAVTRPMAESPSAVPPYVNREGGAMWHGDEAERAPLSDFPPPWASAWGDDVYGLWADLTVNGVTQRMRWIEPSGPEGFWMGSTKEERAEIKNVSVRDWANKHEHEPKRVPIKPGFWLADTPCTQAFWEAVTGKNPSHFSKGRDAPERPVENVSWTDVDEQFVKRFAQTPEWGTGDRLCLPSEEQWEHAARAGTRSAYWWGDDWDAARGNADVTGERGWEDKEGTTPVHRYAPNPWGLYDVHGNVWEWCSDPWRERRDAPEARPDDERRVVRGGSWFSHPGYARAAYRFRWLRGFAVRSQGFRFALRSPAGPEAR